MPFEDELLQAARRAGERAAERQCEADVAKADYHHGIRRLQLSGATMRQIAAAVQLSHQRVQQIVDGQGGGRRWRRRTPEAREMLVCSFSGTDQRQANKLVAGPGVYISASDALKALARLGAAGGRRLRRRAWSLSDGGTPHGAALRKARAKVKHVITTDTDHAPVPRQAKYGIVSICNSVSILRRHYRATTPELTQGNAHMSLSSVFGPTAAACPNTCASQSTSGAARLCKHSATTSGGDWSR